MNPLLGAAEAAFDNGALAIVHGADQRTRRARISKRRI